MKGEKAISRQNRNIWNNLAKFADNLPFSYLKAPQKQQHILMENESNQQRIENI